MSDTGADSRGLPERDHPAPQTETHERTGPSPDPSGTSAEATPISTGTPESGTAATTRELTAAMIARDAILDTLLRDEILIPLLARETAILVPEDAPQLAAAIRLGLMRAGTQTSPATARQPGRDDATDMHVVVVGDPISGFSFFGPTPLHDTADGYHEGRTRLLEEKGEDWWLARLRPLSSLDTINIEAL